MTATETQTTTPDSTGGLPNPSQVAGLPAGTGQDPVPAKPETPAVTKPAVPYKLVAPKGSEFTFGGDVVTSLETEMQSIGVSNEKAQGLVDKVAKVISERHQQAFAESKVASRKAWDEQVLADPEIGGDKWKATEKASLAAIASVKDEARRGRLEKLFLDDGEGLIHHPDIRYLLAKYGEQFIEDTVVTGNAPAGDLDLNDPNHQIAILMAGAKKK